MPPPASASLLDTEMPATDSVSNRCSRSKSADESVERNSEGKSDNQRLQRFHSLLLERAGWVGQSFVDATAAF